MYFSDDEIKERVESEDVNKLIHLLESNKHGQLESIEDQQFNQSKIICKLIMLLSKKEIISDQEVINLINISSK